MRILIGLIISCFFSFSMMTAAKTAPSPIKLLASPNVKAKVIATIPFGTPVMPIFQNKAWVKVANPKNGDVGWVRQSNLVNLPIVFHQITIGDSNYCKHNNCSFSFYSSNHQLSAKQSDELWQQLRNQQRALFRQQLQMERITHRLMEQMDPWTALYYNNKGDYSGDHQHDGYHYDGHDHEHHYLDD